MNDERKWTVVKILSFGVGLGSLYLTGHSVAKLINRWKIARQARYLQDDLKLRLRTPLPMTTIVSRHSDWEHVHQTLFQYLFIC